MSMGRLEIFGRGMGRARAKDESKPVRKGKKSRPPATVAFAANLRLARERKFKYKQDCADALQMERETYRSWERGDREPNITELGRIARLLDVSLDFLIAGHIPALNKKPPR